MRRYVKRAIAVLAVALMCSSLMGGGVMAEDGSGKDGNDGQAVEEAGSNEVVPEVSPEGEPGGASGETGVEEAEVNVEGAESAPAQSKALSGRSASDCPVSIYMESTPWEGTETTPNNVELGDTIEYSVEVENQTMEDLTDVEIKLHIDDALETDISTAQFDLTGSKENIAGNSNFSARLEGNDVVFKAKAFNRGDLVTFYITCTTKTEGVVSSYASVKSVGGTPYSGIDSRVQYHNAYLEVSELTLKSNLNSIYTSTNNVKHSIPGKGKTLSYTFNFMKDSKGLTAPLLYQLKSGDNVIKEDSLKLENGIGKLSFSSKYTLVIPQIPVGVTYNITLKKDSDFTWDKESASGTIEPRTASNITFKGTGKYTPVAYSLDTSIEVNMQGRDFKKGDSFSYSIHCEDGPTFNPNPIKTYGDDDEFADYEGIVRINPSSGRSATMHLEEKIETVTTYAMSCGLQVRNAEYHSLSTGCLASYSIKSLPINTSPEMYFLYPGTYDYIVFQTSMYTGDYDSIIQDTTQYKVSVKVTASGSTLTPSLSSVKKSTDGGKTWVAVADKSKLAFTNKLMPDGVRKGDIDRDGKVTMADVMACLNHVSKKKLLTGQALAAADVDGNGVGMSDVIKILNYVSKKSPSL